MNLQNTIYKNKKLNVEINCYIHLTIKMKYGFVERRYL